MVGDTMYGKIFAACFTGSMVGAGTNVFAVWAYVIANTVAGFVELNPTLLAATLGTTQQDVLDAIAYLCAPDPESQNPEHDGARLVPVNKFVYEVPSHKHYRAIHSENDRKSYMRQYMKNYRANHPVNKSLREFTVKQEVNINNKQSTYTEGVNIRKQKFTNTEDHMRRLREIGFRDSTAINAEHALAEVLDAGGEPDEVVAACCRIFVWTEKGQYAPKLADVIRRYKEPQHLWRWEKKTNGRAKPDRLDAIRNGRTKPDFGPDALRTDKPVAD
jgi:hypothetical protein